MVKTGEPAQQHSMVKTGEAAQQHSSNTEQAATLCLLSTADMIRTADMIIICNPKCVHLVQHMTHTGKRLNTIIE